MHRQQVRRRRAVLAALVGVSIVLLTAYYGESAGGGLHAIQRGAQDVLAPIESGASRVFKPVRDLVNWTGDVLGAQGENEKLTKEVERLQREVAAAQTARRDAAQLRELVDLPKRDGYPEGTDPVAARVIARSPTVWYSTVQIDKGKGDGVEVDQPVVTGGGLAGKVDSVTGGTARVRLITDEETAVSAQIMPDGAAGIVQPDVGDPDDLLLDFIQKGRKVRKGATVVTSGFTSQKLESLFPRGIPIGKVKRTDPDELELYQRVHVEPFADLRRMDYLQVLTGRPERQQTAAEGVSP